MRKILRLDMISCVRVFIVFYAVIGLYASSKATMTGADTILCPFGFEYPYLFLRVNLNINLPNPPNAVTPFLVLISVVFYALTGAISGTAVVLLYNLTSRFWPGISAELEPDHPTASPVIPNPEITQSKQIDDTKGDFEI
jgi:hypothetical protein